MAFDLNSISKTRRLVAPKIVIGGPGKIGKTTFAASAPDAIGILTEDGAHAIDASAFPLATSMDDVYSAMGTLLNEDHDFKSLFVDSLDWMEPLVYDHVCKQNNWSNIEQPGYGKGYMAAATEWRTFLEGLDALRTHRGMAIILIVHDKIKRIEDPLYESFDAHDLKLHDRASALVKEWADILGYAGYELAIKTAKGAFGAEENRALRVQKRTLHMETHPAHFGGNRLNLKNCELRWDALSAQLEAQQ
jgi:hypothetical protein